MIMLEVTAYQCADGAIFENEEQAISHEKDLLGQELDGLLKLFEFGGKLTRNDEYRGLMALINNRTELQKSITAIAHILAHGTIGE